MHAFEASSTAEDWEVEKKPAIPTPEVAIQMKLEFVRKDGEVCELNISEVSRFSSAQFSC